MIEIARNIKFDDGPKMQTIKGHTKIILTDVRSGKKKIVEHDNTFQASYLANMLRSFGVANASPWSNETFAANAFWRNMCGGIFLFRDPITAPCEYMPAGNLMVANSAYGVENLSQPSELGSYNSIESALSGAGITIVYDWGTSQGNGTISCVCLTSEIGGYIGYGNASGNSATLKDVKANQTSQYLGTTTAMLYGGKRYLPTAYDTTNKKITILSLNDQVTQASILFPYKATSADYSYTGDIVIGSENQIFTKPISTSKFIVIKGKNARLESGSTGRIPVFDCSNNTLGILTIVNTSGESVWITNSGLVTVSVDSLGNIYVPTYYGGGTNKNKLAKFNSSGVFVDFVGDADGGSSGFRGGRVAPDIIATVSPSDGKTLLFYDGVAQRPTNGQNTDNVFLEYNDGNDILLQGSNQTIMPYHNPLYLATINNLETAITKDSTQTMKVIYTLTDA